MGKFTKEKFDAIIKSNLTDCMPRVSKDNFGYEINERKYDNYYTFNSFEAFKADMQEG